MQMMRFYKQVLRWANESNPDVIISAHNHNDIGLAVANSLSLVEAAVRHSEEHDVPVHLQIETTVCGLGERAGNADIFALVGGLFKFAPEFEQEARWQFNPEQSVRVANAVLAIAGLEVPRQAPIVGRDINVHRSGIHSDGVLKGGHGIYTPFDPRFWGHDSSARHEKGMYQGRRGTVDAQNAS
jgi:2-isopropylmalate synthase